MLTLPTRFDMPGFASAISWTGVGVTPNWLTTLSQDAVEVADQPQPEDAVGTLQLKVCWALVIVVDSCWG
jgi:hypothetical protein